MAKYVFPAVFTPEENGYLSIHFPDISNCFTSGKGLAEALDMAQDVLNLTLVDMEDHQLNIPPASESNRIPLENNEFINLIKADTIEYRARYEDKYVKKTLSLPAWLNTLAEKEHINCSAVLQEGLKQRLNIN